MKPDFLHIGAPRAASTWLFENLERHPDLWLPPHKNILYFHPRFQRYRLNKLKLYWPQIKSDKAMRRWNLRHFLTPFPDNNWYLKQFPDNPKLIKGECAEAYCSMGEAEIAKIANLIPQVKIIFILRDPIERLISHAKHDLVTRKDISPDNLTADMYFNIIKTPDQISRSCYMQSILKWEKYFQPEQILVLFYEEIVADPQNILQKICNFLGVNYNKEYFPSSKVKERVNASTDQAPPQEVYEFARDALKYDINALAERYPESAGIWKQNHYSND